MKVARNDLCPCGSGKKYKRCHGAHATRAPEDRRASAGVDAETLAVADAHFADRDQHGGPAQQMVEFVQPLLDKANGDRRMTERVMGFGMVFWNLALLPPEERSSALEQAEVEVCKTDDDRVALRRMATVMIARHEAMFPWLHEGRR